MRQKRIYYLLFAFCFFLLSTGTQTSGQSAKTRTLLLAGGIIDVPANYKTEQLIGPDFYVDYLYSDENKAHQRATLGVYTGDYPNFAPPKNAKTRKMRFGNKKITWYIWKKPENNKIFYIYEALINYGISEGVHHLFISGTDAKQAENLLIMFKTYRNSK